MFSFFLTSFSLSVRILISSSYLSSFWEYCGERQHYSEADPCGGRWTSDSESSGTILKPEITVRTSWLCHAGLSNSVCYYLLSLGLQRLQVIGNVLQFLLQLSTFTGVVWMSGREGRTGRSKDIRLVWKELIRGGVQIQHKWKH